MFITNFVLKSDQLASFHCLLENFCLSKVLCRRLTISKLCLEHVIKVLLWAHFWMKFWARIWQSEQLYHCALDKSFFVEKLIVVFSKSWSSKIRSHKHDWSSYKFLMMVLNRKMGKYNTKWVVPVKKLSQHGNNLWCTLGQWEWPNVEVNKDIRRAYNFYPHDSKAYNEKK